MRLASLFSDHMVLQHGIALPVWGWAEPGTEVTVSFDGQSVTGITDPSGKWSVKLDACEVNATGLTLTASTSDTTIRVNDILVGDVWICSGQSNMQWPVAKADNADAEEAAANYPLIRLFSVPNAALPKGQDDVNGSWAPAIKKNVSEFSAVGYFFGREVHQHIDKPIGLIGTHWGGTCAEAWTSREGLQQLDYFQDKLASYETDLPNFEAKQAAFLEKSERISALRDIPADNDEYKQGLAAPDHDDSDWGTMNIPCMWTRQGHAYNGVFWFRLTLDLPDAWQGKSLALSLGACDKSDITYFNNQEVGRMGQANDGAWCVKREYTIDGTLVKAGKNVLAVRAFSHANDGGLHGPAGDMFIHPVGEPESKLSLAGEWRYHVAHDFGLTTQVEGPGNPNSPYILYNSMVRPLIPFAIKGTIWYQGESNSGRAYRYRELFPNMIRDWRKQWSQGDFPFGVVQLANHMARLEQPGESNWAELREAQSMALAEPNTGLAVAIDVGMADDIHPTNKQDVGKRLAYWALGDVYGEENRVISGPRYRSHRVEGSAVRIHFDHQGSGMVLKDQGEPSFALAGEDRVFHWAAASIEGDEVVVSSSAVSAPVSVRYAWANNPASLLYNQEGLPASPFRTDGWPGETWPHTAK